MLESSDEKKRNTKIPFILHSASISSNFFYTPRIYSIPCDWISTSVICFGVCELSIREPLTTVASQFLLNPNSSTEIFTMSAHPMLSNALHASHQRKRVESARTEPALCTKAAESALAQSSGAANSNTSAANRKSHHHTAHHAVHHGKSLSI